MPDSIRNGPRPTTTPPKSGTAGTGALKNDRFSSDATLAQVAAGKVTLTAGAKGDTVKRLQTALFDMGFPLRVLPGADGAPRTGVDGAWGPQTTTALTNFQKHAANFFKDVKPSGQLDAATLKALDALAPSAGAKAWAPGQSNTKVPPPFYDGKQVRVVVVRDEHRTYLYDAKGKIAGIFSNSTGKSLSPTHMGLKVITTKLDENAAKNVGVQLWKDPNAFGQRILDLSWASGANRASGEELHGSYAYSDMGKEVSHGCMRHYNEDIVTLFNALNVGDRVAVVDNFKDPHLKKSAGGNV